VKLSFPGKFRDTDKPKFIEEFDNLLKDIDATVRQDVDVQITENSTILHFELVGANNVNAAFHIEELIRMKKLKLLNTEVNGSTSSFIIHAICPSARGGIAPLEECKIVGSRNGATIRVILLILISLIIFVPIMNLINECRKGEDETVVICFILYNDNCFVLSFLFNNDIFCASF